jgi:hypothetical protein
MLNTQLRLQQSWLSQRAEMRMRSELMTAIYIKALKRKDYSGIVDKKKEEEAKLARDKKGASTPNLTEDASKPVPSEGCRPFPYLRIHGIDDLF